MRAETREEFLRRNKNMADSGGWWSWLKWLSSVLFENSARETFSLKSSEWFETELNWKHLQAEKLKSEFLACVKLLYFYPLEYNIFRSISLSHQCSHHVQVLVWLLMTVITSKVFLHLIVTQPLCRLPWRKIACTLVLLGIIKIMFVWRSST